jgi:hypothetical protein
MAAEKLSVSLDPDDVAWLRQQARKRRKSLSAVLSEAVQQARRNAALDTVLQAYGAPKLTPEEVTELEREWDAD